MCEYCGCQVLAAIAELTAEHDAVVEMISEARAAVARADLAAAAAAARRIAAVLGPHTRVEEDGLFPPLASEYPEHFAVLRAEHRRVEAVLAEAAAGTPADPAWPARLLEGLHVLREHILKEQDGVFPAALIGLSADDWDRVEKVRTEASAARLAGDAKSTPAQAIRTPSDFGIAGGYSDTRRITTFIAGDVVTRRGGTA